MRKGNICVLKKIINGLPGGGRSQIDQASSGRVHSLVRRHHLLKQNYKFKNAE